MLKRIIPFALAITILYFGYHSFNRLRFWDRSVQIFKINSNQSFGRGFDRGRGSFNANFNRENLNRDRTARPDFGNIPDSIRQQFAQRQRPEQAQTPDRAEIADLPQIPGQPDSIMQQNRSQIPTINQNSFRGRGGFSGGDRQRGSFSQRSNVRLNTVYRFLAVFAAITVITIYIDTFFKRRRKKKKLNLLKNT